MQLVLDGGRPSLYSLNHRFRRNRQTIYGDKTMTIQILATEQDRTDVLTIGGDYVSRRTDDVHGSLLQFEGSELVNKTSVEFLRDYKDTVSIYGLIGSLLESRLKGLGKIVDLDLFMEALDSLPIANDPKLYYMGMSEDMLPSITERVAWDVETMTDPGIGRYHMGDSYAHMSIPHYESGRVTIDAVPLFRAWGLDTRAWHRAGLAKHLERTGAALGPRNNYPTRGGFRDELKMKMIEQLGDWRGKNQVRLNQFIVSEDAVLEMAKLVKDTVTQAPFRWVHHIYQH